MSQPTKKLKVAHVGNETNEGNDGNNGNDGNDVADATNARVNMHPQQNADQALGKSNAEIKVNATVDGHLDHPNDQSIANANNVGNLASCGDDERELLETDIHNHLHNVCYLSMGLTRKLIANGDVESARQLALRIRLFVDELPPQCTSDSIHQMAGGGDALPHNPLRSSDCF